jgi:hypothetical protein
MAQTLDMGRRGLMSMKTVRIVLAILYSAALIFSLSRCSPNAASIDKAVLQSLRHHNGTIDNGAHGSVSAESTNAGKQSLVQVHFLGPKEFKRIKAMTPDKDEVRTRLTSNSTNTGSLDEFTERGETEISLERSSRLKPSEVWVQVVSDDLIQQAEAENCSLVVEQVDSAHEDSSRDGSWHIKMRETAECKSRQEILWHTADVIVSFRAKDLSQLVDL